MMSVTIAVVCILSGSVLMFFFLCRLLSLDNPEIEENPHEYLTKHSEYLKTRQNLVEFPVKHSK